jgi:hypothetical protein
LRLPNDALLEPLLSAPPKFKVAADAGANFAASPLPPTGFGAFPPPSTVAISFTLPFHKN